MRLSIVTLFPEFFESPLGVSIVARAIESGILEVELVPLREYGTGTHLQVDDAPYGGGPGMVLMVDPLARALEGLGSSHRVLMAPSGTPMTQATLDRWAATDHVTFVCGRYEGVDQRVIDYFIEEEASLGDFVLAGGEAAALAAVEGVARLLPGVLGNPDSSETESFRDGLLEEPQYTRPADYRGWEVPDVLLSGDHPRIAEWRRRQRIERTEARRPDLSERHRRRDDSDHGDS